MSGEREEEEESRQVNHTSKMPARHGGSRTYRNERKVRSHMAKQINRNR